MAKYKLKSLSVNIAGKLYKKQDKYIFDTEKKSKGIKNQILAAFKAGFLEKVKEQAKENKAPKNDVKNTKDLTKEVKGGK